MNEASIKKHPSILNAREIEQLCKPLEETLNIDYFCHVNVDNKAVFTALGKNPEFVKHYLEQGYYNVDVHLSNNEVKEEYVIQDNVTHYGITEKLFKDCSDFKLNHLFTILQRNENSIDAFHFACSKKNPLMNESYLSNLNFLKLFILNFKDKAFSDKHLKQAYNFQYNIDKTSEGYRSDTIHLKNISNLKNYLEKMNINKFYLPNADKYTYLTKREIECILWLHYGKTAEEISIILNITERTVRAHINNVKEKLHCYTLFQLGRKIAELDVIDLLVE